MDDLCREIDEGKLALLCPSMKRHRRRLFLERLRKGRLGSFMGAEVRLGVVGFRLVKGQDREIYGLRG